MVNVLQSKSVALLQCAKHIKSVIDNLKTPRKLVIKTPWNSKSIIGEAEIIAEHLGTDFNMALTIILQKLCANPPAQTPNEFWRRSLIIPFIDSLIMSLDQRFSEENLPAFSLITFHPFVMLT